jgi:hypothetical protein
MTMTTKRSRGAAPDLGPDDLKLCAVDVTVGRAVFWHDEQREGQVHDVPKHLALQWLHEGLVSVVYEPNPT